MTKVYAFDFDGLLVDGLNECVLVSWNGFHNIGVDSFGPDGLEAIPAKFIDTFKNHRNFSRHLGHFVTPFYVRGHFKNQADFDTAYAAIDESIVSSFVTRVNAYRKAARKSQYKLWLEYHSFYRGMEKQLKEITAPIYIVTGKDAASVDEILQHANISIPITHIFGECRDKVSVLNHIAKMERVSTNEISFFDDNISNACSTYQHGFDSYWATWGYNAPDHWQIAQAAAVPIISLNDFHQINMMTEAEI